jgi:twitching motility protein PilI
MRNAQLSPFEILAGYEQQSVAQGGGAASSRQAAADLWRGVGFRVGEHRLVVSLTEIIEILSLPEVTRVPGARAWLLGVASVRGNLLPLIDLKNFLFGEAANIADSSRVLIVRQAGGNVGLLVDEVYGQRHFSAEQRSALQADDEKQARFVVDQYTLDDVSWGRFSVNGLVRASDFAQAAA